MQQRVQSPSPDYTIEQVVALNAYNPDALPELVQYVEEQVVKQTYSLDANLCLLRFYQIEPKKMTPKIVIKVLVKAMMALPSPDFGLCMSLLPEGMQMSEPFLTLTTLSHYLETARFREFWDEAAKHRDILETVPGFEDAIRRYGVHLLSLTYQRVPRHVLAETVNMEGISLDKFLEYHGWKVQKGRNGGEVVVLPANESNTPGSKKNSADNISMEAVAKLFPILV